MEISNSIIAKLENDNHFTIVEKAYIEKAVKMVDYYEKMIDISIGLTENTENLKFNVQPLNENNG